MKRHPQLEEGELDLSKRKDVSEFLSSLKKKTDQDLLARREWSERITENYQRRYGRLGRNVDFPFPGASNIVIPTIDEQIDKIKAAEVSLFYNVNPICSFIPGSLRANNIDRIRKLEHYFDYRLRYQSHDFFQELILGIDDRLSTGIACFKTLYEFESEVIHHKVLLTDLPGRLSQFSVMKKGNEAAANNLYVASQGEKSALTKQEFDQLAENAIKPIVILEFGLNVEDPLDRKACEELMRFLRSGEESVEVQYRLIKSHYPRLVAVDPLQLILPSWGTHMDKLPRVTQKMWMSDQEIQSKVKASGWNSFVAEQCLEHKSGSSYGSYPIEHDLSYARDERIGLMSHLEGDHLYQVNESHVLYDWNGDGVSERCILTWSPHVELPFRFVASPFDHGEVPFTVIPYELNERRLHSSRGIPEKIKDFDEEITQQHRAKLNRMLISNAPVFTYRRNSAFNPFKVRWIPGEMYQVSEQGDLAAVQMPNLDFSFHQEETILQARTESYVGVPDVALSDPLSNLQEPRTKYEIQSIQAISQRSSGYRTTLFRIGMARVMNQLWSLEQQYGPEEVWVHFTQEEPWKMTKKEIQGKYVVIPRGTVLNSDPEIQAQRTLMNIQVLLQMLPHIANDPRYELDPAQAILDYFQISDPIGSQRIIRKRSREEVQQILAQNQQQNQTQNAINDNQSVGLDVLKNQLDQMISKAPHGGNQRVRL